MTKYILPIVVILVLVVGIYFFTMYEQEDAIDNDNGDIPETPEGTLYLSVKDKVMDMEGVQEVNIVANQIELQSAEGWILLSNETQEFDLLQLQEQERLLIQKKLQEGNYTQLRLRIQNCTIKINGTIYPLKMPSNMLRFQKQFRLRNNESTGVTLDFILNESLHITDAGDNYILAPVVQLQVREKVQAQITANNRVEYSGGEKTVDANIGMDENGDMGQGIKIQADEKLQIENGVVKKKQAQ